MAKQSAQKRRIVTLEDCRGALAGIATRDEDAIRRYPREEDEDGWQYDFVPPYELDMLKIVVDKSIRRATQKTQVITHPLNGHARNRLIHSFDVLQVASMVAAVLRLNADLIRAGSLGHDLAHTPGGHGGEDFIKDVTGLLFRHEIFVVVMLQDICRKGMGLNLTKQVLRVVRWHSRGKGELATGGMGPEERVVMYCDKIGYIFSDFNDLFARQALKAHGIVPEAFPEIVRAAMWFGDCQRERIRKCVEALCMESAETGQVSFERSETAEHFRDLKKLMYSVYEQIDRRRLYLVMERVYEQIGRHVKDVHPAVVFALMNDDELEWINAKIIHHEMIDESTFLALSVGDIIPFIRGKEIDFTKADLDW